MVPSRALRISSSEGTGRSLTALAMTRCFPNCPATSAVPIGNYLSPVVCRILRIVWRVASGHPPLRI